MQVYPRPLLHAAGNDHDVEGHGSNPSQVEAELCIQSNMSLKATQKTDKKHLSLKTCGLLSQANYSEKCAFCVCLRVVS